MLRRNECPKNKGNFVAKVFDEGSAIEGLRRFINEVPLMK